MRTAVELAFARSRRNAALHRAASAAMPRMHREIYLAADQKRQRYRWHNAGEVIGSPGRIILSTGAGGFAADFLQMQR